MTREEINEHIREHRRKNGARFFRLIIKGKANARDVWETWETRDTGRSASDRVANVFFIAELATELES